MKAQKKVTPIRSFSPENVQLRVSDQAMKLVRINKDKYDRTWYSFKAITKSNPFPTLYDAADIFKVAAPKDQAFEGLDEGMLVSMTGVVQSEEAPKAKRTDAEWWHVHTYRMKFERNPDSLDHFQVLYKPLTYKVIVFN